MDFVFDETKLVMPIVTFMSVMRIFFQISGRTDIIIIFGMKNHAFNICYHEIK